MGDQDVDTLVQQLLWLVHAVVTIFLIGQYINVTTNQFSPVTLHVIWNPRRVHRTVEKLSEFKSNIDR